MRAYICTFTIAVAIIVAAIINGPVNHECQWNESRIQMIEAATLENAATSIYQDTRISSIESCVTEWNDLFRTLYK